MTKRMLKNPLYQGIVCFCIGLFAAWLYYIDRIAPSLLVTPSQDQFALAVSRIEEEDPNKLAILRATAHRIKKGDPLYLTLRDAFVPKPMTFAILNELSKVKDLRRLQAGLHFTIQWNDETNGWPVSVAFQFSGTELVQIRRTSLSEWSTEEISVPIREEIVTYAGNVSSSLWESAKAAGMDTRLISDLANVFAWQIDFAREVRPNDRWRIVVEKKMAANKHIGWGNILAAEYLLQGEPYTAVRFPQKADHGSYFTPTGDSLQRIFLKSPLRYGRISSRFRRDRFHPILKRRVPHNGVDYAAPPGTPVRSVGDGRVVRAGRYGSSGIMVKIRHNSTYETAYLHLQRIAKKTRRGSRVKQGQVIGYVGSTGRATGPHLHFSFFENKRFVDPLGKKFPSKDPITKKQMDKYQRTVASALKLLPQWHLAMRD